MNVWADGREIFAFMAAADESKRHDGAAVSLAHVLKAATPSADPQPTR